MGILSILILIPLVGALVLSLLPPDNKLARIFGFTFGGLTLATSLAVLAQFKADTFHFQLHERYVWIAPLGVRFHLGVDGLSIWLLVLTAFLTLIAMAYSLYVETKTKSFLALILVLEAAMIGCFLSLDLILFFTFFEATLIPMWLLVNNWGGEKRAAAANKFLIYTFAGSIFMLVGMVAVAIQMYRVTGQPSFDILDIQAQVANGGLWTGGTQYETLIFWGFALALMVKTPAFPFHTWIADTYAESPIVGPILSSVMVKLGTFGFLRLVFPLFPEAVQSQAPIFMALAVVGILYGAIVAAVQTDIRRLLAYSSLSHMGFILLGLFSLSYAGILGGAYQQLNHGITTSAMFLLVGFLIARSGSSYFADLGGLKAKMPVFAALFLLSMLASVGLPGTNGFVGEFLALLGAFESGYQGVAHLTPIFAVLAGGGVVLAAVYLLYMFQQAMYGPNVHADNPKFTDLKPWETAVAASLAILMLWGGLYPSTFTKPMESSAQAARLMVLAPAGERPVWSDQTVEIGHSGELVRIGAVQSDGGANTGRGPVITPANIHGTAPKSGVESLVGMNP